MSGERPERGAAASSRPFFIAWAGSLKKEWQHIQAVAATEQAAGTVGADERLPRAQAQVVDISSRIYSSLLHFFWYCIFFRIQGVTLYNKRGKLYAVPVL